MKPNPRPDGDRELAGILAGMPAARRRLLDAHRPGAIGVGLGCELQVGLTNRWPRVLYLAAVAARRLGDGPESFRARRLRFRNGSRNG